MREKYEICLERQKQLQAGKKLKLEEFGLLFPGPDGKGISKSTLGDILAKSDEILKNPPVVGAQRKKNKAPIYPIFEGLLVEWIEQAHAVRVPINDTVIQSQARELVEKLSGMEEIKEDYTDFQFSNGWHSAFKIRYGLCRQKFQGEGAGVKKEDLHIVRLQLRKDLEGYTLRDIWNCD